MNRSRANPVWLFAAAGGAAWAIRHGRSRAVRTWRPSRLPGRQVGRLWCRSGGTGDTGVLLLHGLVATGDVFGLIPDLLAADYAVAVPDLLGFGRSLDEAEADFGTKAHLAAIDATVDATLGDRPVHIVAHSMGCALALRWAAQHRDRVRQVVCVGPPIWPSPERALAGIGATGAATRALLADDRLARRLCWFNCRYRTLSGWVAAALAPRWPIALARQASLHTWAAYRTTIRDQVLEVPWTELLEMLDAARIEVRLVWGHADPVGNPVYAKTATASMANVTVVDIPGADHTIPAAVPELIVDLLTPR